MAHLNLGVFSPLALATAAEGAGCVAGSDDQFGPRVDTDCRGFDFTLLFEDGIFALLPAAIFLLLLPSRWRQLHRREIKLVSYRLAVQKLSLLAILFCLHLVYTAFLAKALALQTRLSLPAAIINLVAVLAATWTSFMEDQRSVNPSYLLVIYFSFTSLLSIPRLRSLWLMSPQDGIEVIRGLWTAVFTVTVLVLIAQSMNKLKSLQPAYQTLTKEELSGFWGRSFYIYLLPLLKAGNAKILELDDLPELDNELTGVHAGHNLDEKFSSNSSPRRFGLFRDSLRAYRSIVLWAIPARLALTAFSFSQPFLITTTINFINASSEKENHNSYGPSIVGAYALVYAGTAISTAVYWRQSNRFIASLRAGLIAMTYEQTLGVKPEDLTDSAAITLMGTDVERIATSLLGFHELWASLLEIGFSLWLLGRQVGVACIIPLVIAIVAIGSMGPISIRSGKAQNQWIERVQKRLATTSSMLGDIKALQMLGLSDVLSTIVTKLREIEVKTSLRYRKLVLWQVVISNIPLVLAPFATLAIYAGISVSKNDSSLLSAKAFTSLALISLFTSPILKFCEAIVNFLQAMACFDRIEKYCRKNSDCVPSLPGPSSVSVSVEDQMELKESVPSSLPSSSLISLQRAIISRTEESEPILQNLDLDIHRGITAIIGSVGSGKTTFLEAILGRHVLKNDASFAPLSHVAYAPQQPWITNSTIRENIVGATEYDQKWYDYVVSACGLEEDFNEISGGDQRLAGSKGASLSGGQKQRVALARAVYSKLNVLVLDSPFSGLDSNVLVNITRRLFGPDGHFKQSGRSVVLVTNNYQILSHADNIIVLDQGTISAQGSYREISASIPHIFSELVHDTAGNPENPYKSIQQRAIGESADLQIALESAQEQDMLRQKSSWTVYSYYTKAAGVYLFILSISALMGESFGSSFSTVWVQWWVDANEKAPNQNLGLYIGVYALLITLSIAGLTLCCWIYTTKIMTRISLRLHSDLLAAVSRAPFAFFQTIDIGSITNRFSQDLELIDLMLAVYLLNFFESMGGIFVKLIIICVMGKYLAASVPFIAVAIYFIQSFYLRTSRQVRLLDIEAKAPLYTHFLETIDGIACIRAFGWQDHFRARCEKQLNQSQRPFYMLWSLQQWLQVVINLLVGGIAVTLVAIVTSFDSKFSAASVGVALNLLLSFNENLTRSIKMWTMVEISIGAVTRIQSFSNDTPEEKEKPTGLLDDSDSGWIRDGSVQFDNLSAGYYISPHTILKKISLDIRQGQKVAVCGPSGSGKTSFIMAILRMLDTEHGRISVSGTDLTTVPRSLLRRTINVIPQEPLLFPGSIRFNIDPHGLASDDQIETALKKTRMWDPVLANGGIDEESDVGKWSVGQKQLLELARALLVDSPILIMDEATSSMDWDTESIIQSVIDTEFSEKTVIAVMHRFRYIDRFDRVLLFKHGCLAEDGEPGALLSSDSKFRDLYQAWKRN